MILIRWCRVELLTFVLVLAGGVVDARSFGSAQNVRLGINSVTGIVGQPVDIRVEGTGQDELPSGFMYSVIADVIEYPGNRAPEILTGIPVVSTRCYEPGRYLLRIRVNLINKTSCGGASARSLLDDKVQMIIAAPP